MGVISRARNAIDKIRRFDPEQSYLEEATSNVDLERRQREIDAGRFRRRQWPY